MGCKHSIPVSSTPSSPPAAPPPPRSLFPLAGWELLVSTAQQMDATSRRNLLDFYIRHMANLQPGEHYEMFCLNFADFFECQDLELREAGPLISIHTLDQPLAYLRDDMDTNLTFVSHTWFGPSQVDDESNSVFTSMRAKLGYLVQHTGALGPFGNLWIDTKCIPQGSSTTEKEIRRRQLGVIQNHIWMSSGFLIAEDVWSRYGKSAWCFLEAMTFLCKLLATFMIHPRVDTLYNYMAFLNSVDSIFYSEQHEMIPGGEIHFSKVPAVGGIDYNIAMEAEFRKFLSLSRGGNRNDRVEKVLTLSRMDDVEFIQPLLSGMSRFMRDSLLMISESPISHPLLMLLIGRANDVLNLQNLVFRERQQNEEATASGRPSHSSFFIVSQNGLAALNLQAELTRMMGPDGVNCKLKTK